MSNILVTGSKGQLGSELKDLVSQYSGYNFYFTDAHELDITSHSKVESFIEEKEIEIIINCAAYTAVDKAEDEHESSNALNHLAVSNIARIAKQRSIKLIHISTDYVFNGNSFCPYKEDDTPNPQSVYGVTKLDGEKSILKMNPSNSIIIRTSWLYSSYGNNFVKTMLRLGNEKNELRVIFDQVGTPTYARDLAKVILDILPNIETSDVEIYNFSNEGVCSWYDFAKAIFELKRVSVLVKPIETIEYPSRAKRPFYSVLNKTKIKNKFKINIPHWKESLTKCLDII